MTEKDIYDRDKLKYFIDHGNMICMKGEPNQFTNLMHAYNTWLYYFWSAFFGGGFWAQDDFLIADIRFVNKSLIELFNGPEDEINIGIMSFIDGIKPIQNVIRSSSYIYPHQMTFYDDSCEEFGYHPMQIFAKIMNLIKYESSQENAKKRMREAGIPYTTFNII